MADQSTQQENAQHTSTAPVGSVERERALKDEESVDQEDFDSENQQEGEEENEDGDSDDEEMLSSKPSGPHFDFIDGFFYIVLAILKDILDTTWILGMLVGGIIILFLYLKGVPAVGKAAIAMGVDMIPVLGIIPITILTAIVTIWVTNHPKMVEKLGVAGQIAQKVIKRGK